ncbi:expressed unknown protein [Seminavis robusta]|uniref:Uncharacterized protein n=1 Tax=Seminavis robusta TaxID=568900 RepID=A0A9N8HM12_9STRA|nr:expressed unknown protein [Seminavis robusta]|eukprot:Sro859_g212030.1 n/a (292) ;mRNA; f:33797-34672
MCMTEPISAATISTPTTTDGSVKKNKCVCFAKKVATVVATVEMTDPTTRWHSKPDLNEFKAKAKQLSEHLRQSQPLLALEIEEAYETTRQKDSEAAADLLPTWSTLVSSRRGLERFVLSKQQRRDQAQEVKASRSVVLNLQCLFKRSPMAAEMADTHAEMMRNQYFEFAKPAQLLAQVYGNADAQAVMPYYHDEELEEDLYEEDDLLDTDDAGSLHSMASKESRDSISIKKTKRIKRRKSSNEVRKEGRRKTPTKSKSSSSKSRTKSPMRRVQSLVSDYGDYGLINGARPV